MTEVGIDISGHTSDHVDCFMGGSYEVALTVCDTAREDCPVFLNAGRNLHQSFADPDRVDLDGDALVAVFRQIRDEIGDFCRELLTSH